MIVNFHFTPAQWDYLKELAGDSKMKLSEYVYKEVGKELKKLNNPISHPDKKIKRINKHFRIPEHLDKKIVAHANSFGIDPATLVCIICLNPKLVKQILVEDKE